MAETKKAVKKTAKTTKKETKKTEKPLISANTVIKLTVPAKDAQAAYDGALKKLAKTVKAAGFRKGKVPAKVAEEHLKPEAIIEEALQTVIPELYTEAIKKEDLKPLTYPEFRPVSLNKGEDWIVEAYIAQKPEINLKGYEKVAKKANQDSVKELEKQEKELEKHIKESKDEKHDHSHKAPTLEEQKNFRLQFLYRELVQALKPEIQELLVKEEAKYDLEQLSSQLKQFKIPFEKFLQQRGLTFEQLSNELAAGALARLQTAFIIDAIARDAKLTVEKADLDAAFEKVTDKKLRAQQESDPRYVDMMSQTILRQKVADHLLSI